MLLSRYAEHIYWAGRYLERAEDTARLVKVQSELMLDLPRSVSLGWTPLLSVTGTGEAYEAQGGDNGSTPELQVVTFLMTSRQNPSSVLSCINAARENLRSVRSHIPRSGWEQVNQLRIWANETAGQAVPRRSRTTWADHVMRTCQTINGLMDSTMSHDAAYAFLQIGRHLERADMTTRVLDVQATTLLEGSADNRRAYADITWMAVLRSLSAMQMFRRVARAGVSGSRALNFLLTDEQFPRSVAHCLSQLNRRLHDLPHSEPAIGGVVSARKRLAAANLDVNLQTMAPTELHDFMDHLQEDIGRLHEAINKVWFSPLPAQAERTPAHPESAEPTAKTTTDAPDTRSTQTQWQSTSR